MFTLIQLTEIGRLANEMDDISARLHSAQATGKPTDSLSQELSSTFLQLKAIFKPIKAAHDSEITSEVAAQNRANEVKHEMD